MFLIDVLCLRTTVDRPRVSRQNTDTENVDMGCMCMRGREVEVFFGEKISDHELKCCFEIHRLLVVYLN